NAREYPGIPGPHIEVGHLGNLRQIGAGIDQVGAHDEYEVTVDPVELWVQRVDDEHPHHPHCHLHHFIRVRVVHEGPAPPQLELVDEGLAWIDVPLRDAADAVHAVRHRHAVPMDGGVLGKLVGDEDADPVSLHGLDGGTRRLTVITPQVRIHAGRKL